MEGLPDLSATLPGAAGQGDRPAAANGRAQPLSALAARFTNALELADTAAARRLLQGAAEEGLPAGRLYVEVVRPALERLGPHGSALTAEAISADLVRALRLSTAQGGAGRTAVLSCSGTGLEAVDGAVATAFLEADGWRVEAASIAGACAEMHAGQRDAVELAVAVNPEPNEVLRLATVWAELRRLVDPPVIVFCDFSRRPVVSVARSAGAADAVAHDPQELLGCAVRGLPPIGRRRWGVRLSRSGGTLSLTPTGSLDVTSVSRLGDVAVSRAGSYSRLVVDLRDVADVEPAGALELGTWAGMATLREVEVVVLAGAPRRVELGAQFPLSVRERLED